MDRKAYHGVMPKSVYYRTDGTGRDIYISYDNGGSFSPMLKPGSYNRICIRPSSAVAKSSVKSLHYVSDGTGRDTYIRKNDGGLHSASTPQYFLNAFQANLREYQPTRQLSDPYVLTQASWQTNQRRILSRNASRTIQKCISRLYKTK